MFITPNCQDPYYTHPHVDVTQWQTTTDPTSHVTVRYLYVHGDFTGSNTKFAFYYPAASQYRGRFFESTYPLITTEAADPNTIAFAISHGAYLVSNNNNGGEPAGDPEAGYRTNAASAKFSRFIAALLYGASAQMRGYLYGASGGAYQTLGAAESTEGIWDGFVPMVPGTPNAIPSYQSIQLLALRELAPVLPRIANAMAVGGSGNPFAGLTREQQAALTETSKLGFPLRGWWQYATLNGGAFEEVEQVVEGLDPTYLTDFWSKPGYEGTTSAVQALRIQDATTVTSVSGNNLVVPSVPHGDLVGADLKITSGPLAGQTASIISTSGDAMTLVSNPGITAGVNVTIDNSWLIALQYYQRHSVPTPDEYGWNQYRGNNGQPLEPQRSILVGPILANLSGGVDTGHFYGKMIMLASTMDVQAYPWSADWYSNAAKSQLGPVAFQNNFRLWYSDNADHDPSGPASEANARLASDYVVQYNGEAQQALLDLDAWVTRGKTPASSTTYGVDSLDQVHVVGDANSRGGVQPVVSLTAACKNHSSPSTCRAEGPKISVAIGTPIGLSVDARVPTGQGKIVKVEWDLHGNGTFASTSVTAPEARVVSSRGDVFAKPGTYFVTVRVTSQREPGEPWGLVQNVASIRVVVP